MVCILRVESLQRSRTENEKTEEEFFFSDYEERIASNNVFSTKQHLPNFIAFLYIFLLLVWRTYSITFRNESHGNKAK